MVCCVSFSCTVQHCHTRIFIGILFSTQHLLLPWRTVTGIQPLAISPLQLPSSFLLSFPNGPHPSSSSPANLLWEAKTCCVTVPTKPSDSETNEVLLLQLWKLLSSPGTLPT